MDWQRKNWPTCIYTISYKIGEVPIVAVSEQSVGNGRRNFNLAVRMALNRG